RTTGAPPARGGGGEPVGVLPFVGAVEALGDLVDRRRVDLALWQEHLDAVFLVLVAELAVAEEAHLRRVDPLPRELLQRSGLHLVEQAGKAVGVLRRER